MVVIFFFGVGLNPRFNISGFTIPGGSTVVSDACDPEGIGLDGKAWKGKGIGVFFFPMLSDLLCKWRDISGVWGVVETLLRRKETRGNMSLQRRWGV